MVILVNQRSAQLFEDYLQRGKTKKEIWHKYTGSRKEHGLMLYWMYKYGYISDSNKKIKKLWKNYYKKSPTFVHSKQD